MEKLSSRKTIEPGWMNGAEIRRSHYLAFAVGTQVLALSLLNVERLVHVVEITPLPGAPGPVAGIINVEGSIIPVYDLRKLLHAEEREIELSDQLILAFTPSMPVALLVDRSLGVIECLETEHRMATSILKGDEPVQGILKMPDGLLLICNLENFLSPGEKAELEKAMETMSPETGSPACMINKEASRGERSVP